MEITNEPQTTQEEIKKPTSKKTKWIIFAIIFLGLTLPFHYVPSEWLVFGKESWGFSNTIITEDDIQEIQDDYHSITLWNIERKREMEEDPLIQKLLEEEVIVKKTMRIPKK